MVKLKFKENSYQIKLEDSNLVFTFLLTMLLILGIPMHLINFELSADILQYCLIARKLLIVLLQSI